MSNALSEYSLSLTVVIARYKLHILYLLTQTSDQISTFRPLTQQRLWWRRQKNFLTTFYVAFYCLMWTAWRSLFAQFQYFTFKRLCHVLLAIHMIAQREQCDISSSVLWLTGVIRRQVLSASHQSEHALLTHLQRNAAQTLVDDVIDHVTLQLRDFHISRLVSNCFN